MKLGLGISLVLHTAGFILLSDLDADEGVAQPPDEVVTLDVEILTEAEFVSTTSPVPISHAIIADPSDALQHVEINVAARAITPPEINERRQQLLTAALDAPDRPEIPIEVPPMMTELPTAIELAPPVDETEEFTFGVESGVVDETRFAARLNLKLAETLQLPEAPRVDRTITPESRPELARDDELRAATRPEQTARVGPAEESDAASAPEQSTLKIVTEAERADDATTPVETHSMRLAMLLSQGVPRTRPPATNSDADAITDAIVDDVIDRQIASSINEVPLLQGSATGPLLLTRDEKARIKSAIQQEWNIGPLSSEVLYVTVTVRFQLDQAGRVISQEMISSSGGGNAAVQKAYDAAKRAINKAFENGVDLPAEKYESWKEIEMRFNPEDMRRL